MEEFYYHPGLLYLVKSVRIWSFFYPVFSRGQTEYEDLLYESPYSVRMPQNTDQKKNSNSGTFQAVLINQLYPHRNQRFSNLRGIPD